MSEAAWIAIGGIAGTGAVGLGAALLQHYFNLKGRREEWAHEKERTLEQLRHQNLERHIAEVESYIDNAATNAGVWHNYASIKDQNLLEAEKLGEEGLQLAKAGVVAGTRARIAAIVLKSDVFHGSILDLISLNAQITRVAADSTIDETSKTLAELVGKVGEIKAELDRIRTTTE